MGELLLKGGRSGLYTYNLAKGAPKHPRPGMELYTSGDVPTIRTASCCAGARFESTDDQARCVAELLIRGMNLPELK